MSVEKQTTFTEEQVATAVKNERLRIAELLLKNRQDLTQDYKHTIKHTGGLLTTSMTYAYSRGLNDAFKLITKEPK